MATELKLRRGTTSQHSSFVGAEAEVTVDTDKETVVVHDGTTVGGYALAREDMSNVPNDAISGDQIAGGDATFDSINVDSGTLFVDSVNNRVGIGTSSPSRTLEVNSGGDNNVAVFKSNDIGAQIIVADNDSSFRLVTTLGGILRFDVGGDGDGDNSSEAARIDSSGNLLVGTSSDNPNDPGARMFAFGTVNACRDNARPVIFGRNTSDGDIVEFRKDGSKVGSIGVSAGSLFIGGDDTGLLFREGFNKIYPSDTNDPFGSDGVLDLGGPNQRFKDLYLSGGVYLGGTGSANKLDDYEEGTWTPEYIPESGSFASISYRSSTVGTYTKIGNVVTIRARIDLNSVDTSGASGTLRVGGLPFSENAAGHPIPVSIAAQTQWGGAPQFGITSSGPQIVLAYINDNSSNYTQIQVSDMNSSNDRNRIDLECTYITDD